MCDWPDYRLPVLSSKILKIPDKESPVIDHGFAAALLAFAVSGSHAARVRHGVEPCAAEFWEGQTVFIAFYEVIEPFSFSASCPLEP